MVVRLADVNDNSPRLARQLWELEVDETWGKGPPNNTTILEVSAADRDTSNYFYYRVSEDGAKEEMRQGGTSETAGMNMRVTTFEYFIK